MIYVLVLNPTRGAAEDRQPVAVSLDRQTLVDWVDEQRHRDATGAFAGWSHETKRRVDTFNQIGVEVDYTWHYTFKEGSPIQEFNLPGEPTIVEHSGPFTNRAPDPNNTPYGEDGYGCGIINYPDREEQADIARREWDRMMASLVTVPEGTTI